MEAFKSGQHVFIVDPDAGFCTGLIAALQSQFDITVREFREGEETLEQELKISKLLRVVFATADGPSLDAMQLTRSIRHRNLNLRVVICFDQDFDDATRLRWQEAGASFLHVKGSDMKGLIEFLTSFLPPLKASA